MTNSYYQSQQKHPTYRYMIGWKYKIAIITY